jgi:CBS domain-containing protein
MAAAAATSVRFALHGSAPMFDMPILAQPSGLAMASYVVIGALIGLTAVGATRAIYAIEDAFEKLPMHWMWWPAIGAVAVGAIGLVEPRTLGVGYEWIEAILANDIAGTALLWFVLLKFVSWSIYLGSGTSGGTLAPLFIIGGGLGAVLGGVAQAWLPQLGVEVPIAALLGMAAIFAGASHALLASVVFAFETTRQPLGLLPLLAGCSASYLVSITLMRNSIMTEKLARRGTIVRTEYAVDYLDQVIVSDAASRNPVTLPAEGSLRDVRAWLVGGAGGATHQGFPVVDAAGSLVGLVTRRDLFGDQSDSLLVRDVISRPPVVVFETNTLRDAADHMTLQGVGRLAVVATNEPGRITGIISRSDILAAHAPRLRARDRREGAIQVGSSSEHSA